MVSGHARDRAAWFGASLAGAALAIAPAGVLPPAFAMVAMAVTFGVTPGVWLARRLALGEASDARAALALLLAPFASGVLLVLPRLAGAGAEPTARALAIVLGLLAVWEALRPTGRLRAAPAEPAVWLAAAVAGSAVLVMHVLSPALSERSDGAFHAGVAWAALRALPPEDPFFAGLALRYFWGPHAWAAGWLALSPGLGAYAPFVVSSTFALVAALLAVGALARRLGASARVSMFAQMLALTGTVPFAWLTLAAPRGAGEVHGAAAWSQALDHGADRALRSLDPGTLHPSLVLPLDKFVVLTPFAWGLAGAVLLGLALAAVLDAPAWRSVLRLAVLTAAVLFVHPVAGVALAAAALAGLACAAVGDAGARRAARYGTGAVAVALLLLAPYVMAVAGPGTAASGALALGIVRRGLVSVMLGGAFLFPVAAAMLLHAGKDRTFRRALAGALVVLALPACLLRLGGDNQSKFLNLAFILAAAPAAVGWTLVAATPRRRELLGVLCTVAWAPTLVAMAWAYAHQSELSADAPSRPPPALLSAIRQWVPLDAVLIDATQDTTRGAAPALPGATGRALLWSGGFMARKWGYRSDALLLRARAAEVLASGHWPAGRELALVAALGREPWVLAPDDSAHHEDPRWHVMARADGVVLARFAAP